MKKALLASILVAGVAMSGCSMMKKVKNSVSASDVNSVAKLVDMSFGSGENGPFEVSKTTKSDSTLVIQNDTDRTITVKANGGSQKTFVVKAGKNDSAQVKPGKYHFVATAPNTKGCEGDVKLEGFNEYKWIFIIK
jgi:hypothetical protein